MMYRRFLYLISLSTVLVFSKTYIEGEEPNLITDTKRNSIISNLTSKSEKSSGDDDKTKKTGKDDKSKKSTEDDDKTKKTGKDDKSKKSDDAKSTSNNTNSNSSKLTSSNKPDDSKLTSSDSKSAIKVESSGKSPKDEKSDSKSSGTNSKTDDKQKTSGSTKNTDDKQKTSGSTKDTDDKNKKSKLVDSSDAFDHSTEEPLKISRLIGTENPSTQNQKSGLTDNLFEFASKLDGSDQKTKDTNILSNLASPIFGNLNEGSHHGSSQDKTNLA